MPDKNKVVPFERPIRWDNLRTDEAQRVVRKRAEDNKIKFSYHAEERQEERDFNNADAMRIIKEGYIQDPPIKNEFGDWEVKVVRRMPGGRDAAAAIIILTNDDHILIKTVMWMD